MLRVTNANRKITFRGADRVSPVSNKQIGPTCGFEAVANVIQLCHPELAGTDLVNTDLLARAAAYRSLISPGRLSLTAYQRILHDYSIPVAWYPFDHYSVLLPALFNNQCVLVVGDASALNSVAYPPNSAHAFVLTNFYTDESPSHVGGYTGIDSNFPFRADQFRPHENYWTYQAVESAARWGARFVATMPVMIPTISIRWPIKVRFYIKTRSDAFIPVPY